MGGLGARPGRCRVHLDGKCPQRRKKSAGQSLVEFTLVLPVLLLIVLGGIDMGRAYEAWIALNNAARVAANYASLHPEAWDSLKPNLDYQAEYRNLLWNDFQNSGCILPVPTIPDPAFPTGRDLGDEVIVTLDCEVPVMTPFVSNVVGSQIHVTAQSIFAVRGGLISGGGSGGGSQPVASFTLDPSTGAAPLTVTFTNTSTGTASGWYWDFGDLQVSTAQNPGTHTYVASGTYIVQLIATGTGGSTSAEASVTVLNSSAFSAGISYAPSVVTATAPILFTGTAAGGTPAYTYSWVFGDGTVDNTNTATPTHAFANEGTYTVTLTVHDSTAKVTTATSVVVVGAKTCTLPPLVGTSTQHAQKAWNDAGFQTNVTFNPGTGHGNNYTIKSIGLTPSTGPYPCATTVVEVRDK
jgi:PKD repeat protein